MGAPVTVNWQQTVRSCAGHDSPTPGCPWCWVMNQRLDGPSNWKALP